MSARRQRIAIGIAAASFVFVSVSVRPALGQAGCPSPTPAPNVSVQFPRYSGPASAVTAGDNFVYVLMQLGFTRTSIVNPDQPGVPQLAQVGHNRGTGGLPPNFTAGDGGRVVLDCDCYTGGSAMAVAEDPSGNSRAISDWLATISQIALPDMVAKGEGDAFGFGQQINAQAPTFQGSPVAAVYTSSGKFFGYFPGSGIVQKVDLTTTTGIAGQTCGPFLTGCFSDPAAGLQTSATLPWNIAGLWAGSASIGGATTYLLVGLDVGTGSLRVATLDPATGVPTPVGSVSYGSVPSHVAIGSVYDTVLGKWRGFLFSAERNGGLRAYEVQNNSGTYSIVAMPQPIELGVTGFQTIDDVSVNRDPAFPSDPPLLFLHRTGTSPTNVEIWDTTWLFNGQPPRLGAKVPHLGKTFPDGSILNSSGFGAKVKKSGTTVNAYVFEVVLQLGASEDSIASSRKDVSCIAVDPTAPAVANLLMTNKRTGATNCSAPNTCYYGDRWMMRDATATGVPLINVAWDLNVPSPFTATQFSPDAAPTWSMAADGTVPQSLEILDNAGGTGTGPGIFWPCDPDTSGNPATGVSCNTSVAGSSAGGNYAIGIRTKNPNPAGNPTPSTYVAGAATVIAPQARIANMVGGVVSILTGGQVDGSISDGNLADAAFSWTFTGCGSCPTILTVQRPNAPVGATGFTLRVTYGDGYQSVLTGTLNQTDLVASFSLSPSSVLHGSSLTLTNLMQKSPLATLNNVGWVMKLNGNPLVPPQSGTLAASFLPVNGQASLTAPSPGSYPASGYTVELIFNFTPSGGGIGSQTVSQAFTIVDWTPAPSVQVFLDPAGTVLAPGSFFPPPTLLINNNYYVKDTEGVPGGITYPGADYYYSTNASQSVLGDTFLGNQPGPAQSTQLWVPTSAQVCGTCYLKAKVSGVVSAYPVVVVTSSPLSASVAGPSPATGSIGVPVSFTANVSGGIQPYSYSWACQYAGQFSAFVPGGLSTQCTYPSAATYQVAVQVTDSQSNLVVSSPFSIVIGGGGGGSLSVSVSGPTTGAVGTPLTFTANASGGSPSYSYQWACQFAGQFTAFVSGGASFACTYPFAGTSLVVVRVTDSQGNIALSGPFTIVVTGSGPPSAAYSVSVGGSNLSPSGGTYTVEAGKTVTFTASEIPANVAATNGYAWSFPDGSTKYGQQVSFSFAGNGAKQVTLTVTGDGVNRVGTTPAVIPFNILVPSFQAMLVSSAEHSAVLADPNGILKFWATDVSVANPGSAPVTISPAFLSFTATQGLTFDLSTINFDPALKVTIPGGGQHSWVDIVKILAGDVANKGTLVLKYEGGNATPLVTARVYFAPAADPLGPASGSALPSFRATSDGQVVTQSTQVAVEQDLPGLRGDASFYFRVTLFNSSSTGGTFRLSAVDERGVPVSILDPSTGAPSSGIDFAIGPYRAIDWSNDSLGLNDPTRRYVLKAHRTSSAGHLVASAAVRDRLTRDQVLVSSDVPPVFSENCVGSPGQCVNYIVPGASRFLGSTGARWRTGLAIFNPSLSKRGVGIEYHYQDTALAAPEQVAKNFLFLDPGQLAFYDDVVAQVFATVGNNLADPSNGTAGILRIVHFADADTSTAPLIISARNYDDQPTGTVGSQLSVYTQPISIGPNEPSLRLAGAQADATDGSNPKPRFETILSVFSFDDTQTTVRLTAVKNDGTVLGFHDLVLNQPGAGGHFQPRNLNISDFHAVVNEPVTIKVDVMSGGRVGAYALIRDLVTRDPTYVQAVPQN